MSLNDENGFTIFTASATGTGIDPPVYPHPTPGGPEASPVPFSPSQARAATSCGRPWKVLRIDSERSEIRDTDGNPINVVGDHETVSYIVEMANEGIQ